MRNREGERASCVAIFVLMAALQVLSGIDNLLEIMLKQLLCCSRFSV